jgi:non-ribosomal peptide synthetase component F
MAPCLRLCRRQTVRDFSGVADAQEQAFAYMQEVFSRPFHSLESLLWETQLVVLGPTRSYWLHRNHHLVTDALGMCLFGHACADAYNRLLAGDMQAPAPAPSYLDFVKEDQAYLAAPRFAADVAFWRQLHATLPPHLFERARNRKLDTASPSQQIRWTLERGLFDRLTAFAGAHGHSIATLLMGVLCVHFSRTSLTDQVVIGLPVHNRTSARHKRTFGAFASVIPIGIAVDPAADFVQLMDTISAELRLCYRHKRLPIAEINRTLKLLEAGRRQLFDVTLSYETQSGVIHFGTADGRVIVMHNGHGQTPLAISVQDFYPGEDIKVDFDFNTAALQRHEVEDIVRRVRLLLDSVVDLARLPIARLPLLDAAEREQVLHGFNVPAAPLPEALVHTFFEEQAARTPEATALIFEATTLSYAELNARANRLAHNLIALGLGPDQRVALCLQRGIGMVVALLATLKAGAAYVPLDPASPPERLAYVIYTSGSTGQPKGMMVEHASVSNLWYTLEERIYQHRPGFVRISVNASLSFDASIQQLVQLLSGRTLVIVPQAIRLDAPAMVTFLDAQRIDALDCTPSHLSMLMNAGLFDGHRRHQALVLVGGEAIDPATRKHMANIEGLEGHNVYGPTESTVDVTTACIDAAAPHPPIGRPLANMRIYLLDAHGESVPVGVPGEIHIGGVQVARGYLNRPELTAQRFLPDPFYAEPGARMYRTGDLGRWRPDGSITFLGRNDHQVKIRGFRIEPACVRPWCWPARTSPATSAWWPTSPAMSPQPRHCEPIWPPCCPSTWCRPPTWRSTSCRWRPTASSTAARYLPPKPRRSVLPRTRLLYPAWSRP